MKHIDVDIGPGGEVEIDAVGFSGPDCEEATKFLEEALGQHTVRKRKPEYWRQRRRTVAGNKLGKSGGG